MINYVPCRAGDSMTVASMSQRDASCGGDIAAGKYRVLHVVDESLPLVSGYAVRTSGIVQAQLALGNSPMVLTGPAHQIREEGATDTVIGGVAYLRTPLPPGISQRALRGRWPLARELAIVRLLRGRIEQALDSGRFDIVHAHSPVLCGLAALQAAESRNLPLVYEIRAFWEDAAVDQSKTTMRSPRYYVSRQLENFVVNRADAVVGIAESILAELRSRGVDSQKLFHMPNGVDTDSFQPMPKDAELAAKVGVGGVPVLGFIGSLFYFEGISWLVRAAVELHRRGLRFKLLIIGHGEDAEAVTREIAAAGAQDYILFPGKVPHQEVKKYYSIIDVMVYPRRSIRLTELVTPLKPLEAMALRRAVLGSSVGGIRELVDNERTGLLFAPENVDDFCRQATRLISDCALRSTLAYQGRDMVLQEKQWNRIAARYHKIYDCAWRVKDRRAASAWRYGD
jgi:PEP-CTERM/exosortase A-associated glycosyltransferase